MFCWKEFAVSIDLSESFSNNFLREKVKQSKMKSAYFNIVNSWYYTWYFWQKEISNELLVNNHFWKYFAPISHKSQKLVRFRKDGSKAHSQPSQDISLAKLFLQTIFANYFFKIFLRNGFDIWLGSEYTSVADQKVLESLTFFASQLEFSRYLL